MSHPKFTGEKFISPELVKARRRNAVDALDFYGRAIVNEPQKYSDAGFAAAAEEDARRDYRKAKVYLASLDDYDADWTPEYKAWVQENANAEWEKKS